jgi:ABC-2 type transport system ATP-binding protein
LAHLHIDNLSKSFGNVHALRGITFTIERGEIFGYLGPNGAGKTTTLRIVVGMVYPEGGDVLLSGKPIGHADRVNIGYLPGELHLYGNMTGIGLLDYFARCRPQRPPVLRERLSQKLGLTGDDLSRKIKSLSHGTKQKIGLLIAMQHDPDLLLLDEPTLGLDPLMQHEFLTIVRDCASRGRTVVFSSHILSEVEAVCGRVAILRAGELVALESIDGLQKKMVRRLSVRFRATPPDNLESVPGVVRIEGGGNEMTMWVKGDLNPILGRLAQASIDRFVFPEPELEDIFLSYYRTGSERG